jgi:hypothetical protein
MLHLHPSSRAQTAFRPNTVARHLDEQICWTRKPWNQTKSSLSLQSTRRVLAIGTLGGLLLLFLQSLEDLPRYTFCSVGTTHRGRLCTRQSHKSFLLVFLLSQLVCTSHTCESCTSFSMLGWPVGAGIGIECFPGRGMHLSKSTHNFLSTIKCSF